MAHCQLCERLLALPPLEPSPWQNRTEEIASLIIGDLAVNTARVREAVARAAAHTAMKQDTAERALYQHLSAGNPFETWPICQGPGASP